MFTLANTRGLDNLSEIRWRKLKGHLRHEDSRMVDLLYIQLMIRLGTIMSSRCFDGL